MLSNSKKLLYYLGAAVRQGQTLRGVDKAPDALRQANLFKSLNNLSYQIEDLGNISYSKLKNEVQVEEVDSKINNIHILDPVLQAVRQQVIEASSKKDGFMLTVGGDHSVATGTISGLKEVYPNLKVIWVDAHADIGLPHMTDSTTYHGKPVSHLMGIIQDSCIPNFDWLKPCLKPEDIVYIGIRDLDKDEIQTLQDYNIKCYTLDHIIQAGGIGNVMEETLLYLDPKKEGLPLHISWDIDGVDPMFAPGTGTRARGGLDYRESHYILRRLCTENLVSMDMVEINPDLDPQTPQEKLFGDDPFIEGTPTVALGCDLILTALGRNNLLALNKHTQK